MTTTTKTVSEYLNGIEPKIQARLLDGIRALLNAGRDTNQVAEALSPQVSFGKYDGCYPQAIRAIAIDECRKINAAICKENNEIARLAVKSLREQFPSMSQYFHR